MLRASLLLALVGCGRVNFDPGTTTPDAPTSMGTIAEVIAGGLNTCARTHAGDVYCWGFGPNGHIGNGTYTSTSTPMRASLEEPVVALDISDAGVCGIVAGGTTYCWGLNAHGTLGLGHGSIVDTPTRTMPADIAEVSLGYNGACVRHTSGLVSCAGREDLVGTMRTGDQPTFEFVPGVTDVIALTSGDNFSCALRSGGDTQCWGNNDRGQIGDGSMTARPTPVAGPVGPYVQLAAGDNHICARKADGTVDCWGRNDLGQLGDTTMTTRSTAAAVVGLTDAIDIAAGSFTSCALHAGGTVSCWGDNGMGNLGDGSGTPRPMPGPVAIADVVDIAARTSRHFCGVTRSGVGYCWGDNGDGQIGNPTVAGNGDEIGGFAPVPVRVEGLPY